MERYRNRVSHFANRRPFATWMVFERLPEFGEDHGPKRFSLLYLCADGVATYQALYWTHGVHPRAIAIIHAADESTHPSPELLEELSIWQARFNAQLISTKGSQPDSEAPIDAQTGQGKRYVQLHAFIRAILYTRLKRQQQQQ